MRIGELANATGMPVETIRYYEREGLLPRAARAANNYRVYQPAHLERLAFIRQCRSLDMALEEIRALLDLRDGPAEDCAKVNDLLDAHIDHVARRIAELKGLQRDLRALRDRCPAPHAMADCGILNGLEQAAAAQPAVAPRRLHVHD